MSSSNSTAALAEPPSPFADAADGVRVRIRLTPKAAANRVIGCVTDAQGTVQLKATVTAVPEKGKSNRALLKMLAKEWHAGMRQLSLIGGHKDRNKTVLVAGETATVRKMLEQWLLGLE